MPVSRFENYTGSSLQAKTLVLVDIMHEDVAEQKCRLCVMSIMESLGTVLDAEID